MRTHLTTLALTVGLLLVTALPAFAHASLDKKQVPADTEIELTVRVPIEIESDNAEIRMLVPEVFDVVSCTGPDGWACEIDDNSNAPDHVVVWSSADGTQDERFTFTVRTPPADEQGVYVLPTVQTYTDGTEARWIQQESGGDRPAPALQVGDENAEIVNNDAQTPHTAAPTDQPTQEPSPSDVPTATPSAEPSGEPDEPAPNDDGTSLLPVVIVVALLAVAGAGLAVGFRRGRTGGDA